MKMEHCCPWWLAYTFDNPLRRLVQDPDRILGPHVRPGMTAMDLGCGMGYFSIALARLVGEQGRVISVDLQPEMLAIMRRRADKAGVGARIEPRPCAKDDLKVSDQVDFAMAMWMVHEVPDQDRFLGQVAACLKPGANFLIAEPKIHVPRASLDQTIALAQTLGLTLAARPPVGLSHAALLERAK